MISFRGTSRAVRLETERFQLTTISRLQATWHTYPWTFDPQVMQPLGHEPGSWTWRGWHRQFRRFNNRTKFCFAIRPKEQTRPIGIESFEISGHGVAFLTVIIGEKTWWGKGVVLETRTAILNFLFERKGCTRAWGMLGARNLPSVYNYQALGFACEGVLRRHTFDPATGKLQDNLVFGMLREEWLGKRRGNAS